jgi:hypothetical protein
MRIHLYENRMFLSLYIKSHSLVHHQLARLLIYALQSQLSTVITITYPHYETNIRS